MAQSPLNPRAALKTIAILVLALTTAAPVFASSYNFRVAAQGLKPSPTVPSAPTASEVDFSSCGQTGRTGPTLASCQAAYAGQPALLAALAMPGYQGYQEWTVPVSGNYTITAAGAGGGTTPQSVAVGGRGAILRGTFNLTVGTVLQVVVGQAGIAAQTVSGGSITDAGGGGGTFVVKKAGNVPLLVAGGGGGANYYSGALYYGSGGDGATAPTAADPPTSVNHNSGTLNYGEPGGGFAVDGALPGCCSGAQFTIAQGFNSGAVGGISTASTTNRFGGFGGGAGSHGNSCVGAGAGGGYAGGIGSAGCGGGGGGSSFIAGNATNKASSNGAYNGTGLGTVALGFVPNSTVGYVTIVQN